jgi:hypothetical protein
MGAVNSAKREAVPALHLGAAGQGLSPLPSPLTESMTLALGGLRLAVDPARATLTAANDGGALHYFRYADATLKPLPSDPPPLILARGDAYIAVVPGPLALADSPAIARFLHLRDYFNAQRLAEALLAHLAETGGAAGMSIVVVEAR